MVTRYWEDKERESINDPIPFSIHEQDRTIIRQNIINAIISSPLAIRYVVYMCVDLYA